MAKLATLVDAFASADTTKWSGWPTGTAISGGRLSLTPTTSYPGISSTASWDLTSSQMLVQLVQMPTAGTTPSVGVFVELGVDDLNGLRWDWSNGGALTAVRTIAGTDTVIAGDIPYTAGMWVRIREASGVVSWDWSTTGSAWTTAGSWTSTIALTAVTASLYAGYYNAGETAPAPSALLDNVNLPPASAITVTAGQATSAGSVFAVGRRHSRPLGQPGTAETALPVTARKARAIGQSAETAVVQTVRAWKTRTIGGPQTSESALPVTSFKRRVVGVAATSDLALPVLARPPGTPIGMVVSSTIAFPVTARKSRPLGVAVSIETATPLGRRRSRTLGLTSTTAPAGLVAAVKRRALGQASTTTLALPVTVQLSGGGPARASSTRVQVQARRRWVRP